jgi:hypothetical protein
VSRAELRVDDVLGVAIRKPEVHARPWRAIELVIGNVVAHVVAPVVGEPELVRLRIPVEADAVAYAARENLHAGSVGFEARDRGIRGVAQANVAGRADGNVEEAVGTETDELPAVQRVVWIAVVEHDRVRRMLEVALDVVIAEDSPCVGHVEGAVAERDTVRRGETRSDHQSVVTDAVVVSVDDGVNHARTLGADEERSILAERHLASVLRAAREEADVEAGWELDRAERVTLGRLSEHGLRKGTRSRYDEQDSTPAHGFRLTVAARVTVILSKIESRARPLYAFLSSFRAAELTQ